MGSRMTGYFSLGEMHGRSFRTGIATLALAGFLGTPGLGIAEISFTDVTATAGPFHVGESWGAAWGDLNADGWPDIFTSNHRMRPSVYRNNGDGTFTDWSLQADMSHIWVTQPLGDTHGGTWADFNKDGKQDLFILTGTGWDGQFLINEGGYFIDRAKQFGVAGDGGGRFPIWLDYNRDGWLDTLMLMTFGKNPLMTQTSQSFVNRASTAGIEFLKNNYAQLSDLFGEPFGDGQMELILAFEGSFPNRVYDFSKTPFQDMTADSRLRRAANVIDTAIADFDGDLRPDMFLVRGALRPNEAQQVPGTNKIEAWLRGGPPTGDDVTSGGAEKVLSFRSDGEIGVDVDSNPNQVGNPLKVFIGATGWHPTAIPFSLSATDPSVQGVKAHDINRQQGIYIGRVNGQWEIRLSPGGRGTRAYLFIEGTTAPVSDVALGGTTPVDAPLAPKLFMNNATGFQDLTRVAGLNQPMSCVSAAAGDFDNDRDVDLYLVCRGGVSNLPNLLYENLGKGTFRLVPSAGGAEGVVGINVANRAGTGDSVVVADYDVDGFLDLFVTNGLGLQPFQFGGPNQLFRNQGNANHWIELDLVGVTSNNEGIGAKVFVQTPDGVWQLREQNGGYHRWSQHHQRIHVGLGPYTVVKELRIQWPNGAPQSFSEIAADRLYRVREGSAITAVSLSQPTHPTLKQGDECGAPVYDPKLDTGIFLWKDCATGEWSLRATAGGSADTLTYQGRLSSNGSFTVTNPFSLEQGDRVDTSVPGVIDYRLGSARAGQDGFGFRWSGTMACLRIEAPANAKVLVGSRVLPARLPLDLSTLGSCS